MSDSASHESDLSDDQPLLNAVGSTEARSNDVSNLWHQFLTPQSRATNVMDRPKNPFFRLGSGGKREHGRMASWSMPRKNFVPQTFFDCWLIS